MHDKQVKSLCHAVFDIFWVNLPASPVSSSSQPVGLTLHLSPAPEY